LKLATPVQIRHSLPEISHRVSSAAERNSLKVDVDGSSPSPGAKSLSAVRSTGKDTWLRTMKWGFEFSTADQIQSSRHSTGQDASLRSSELAFESPREDHGALEESGVLACLSRRRSRDRSPYAPPEFTSMWTRGLSRRFLKPVIRGFESRHRRQSLWGRARKVECLVFQTSDSRIVTGLPCQSFRVRR
jgi:hypothetical protein